MSLGLVHAIYSLPEWQAVKLTFFAPFPATKNNHDSFLKFFLQSLFTGNNNIQIRYDLLDCNISICSTTVSYLLFVVYFFFTVVKLNLYVLTGVSLRFQVAG